MKWFSNTPISTDPIERAEQCVKYLSSSAERPEREATIRLLLETVRESDLPVNLYTKIVSLDAFKVNFYLAMFGDEYAIDTLLGFDGLTQYLLSNILCNRNLKSRHYDLAAKRIDDSPKGERNRERLDRKIQSR
jgi:hypothetical protein